MATKSNPVREIRTLRVSELRSDKADDGKQYLSGYAANYNQMSEDLGWGLRERIMPGCFSRAIREKQDVRHLINHDPNRVLGRTAAGTTELSEDKKGLKFRTLLPDTSYARDLAASVERGDVNECSFGFMVNNSDPDNPGAIWREVPDPEDNSKLITVRELHDVNLMDVSTVTYPAYPKTNTALERSLFPDGIPAEIRSHMQRFNDNGECECACPECQDGECDECSNEDCDDENCRCAMRSLRAKKDKPKTKRVDGEDLTSDCFLIVGNKEDTSTWKLPWRFSSDEKTKSHLQNALARFNQLKGVSEDDKKKAWDKLVELCKEHDIDVSEEKSSLIRSRLTADQIYDFEKDQLLAAADAKVRAIQASL